MPLKAVQDNETVFAWSLEEKDREKEYRCPFCNDSLIPVLPSEDITNHFRHKNEEAHMEPETPEHIAMKRAVFNLLKERDKYSVKMEEEVVSGWIADVVVEKKDRTGILIVECQCSSISTDRIRKRYIRGARTLWIFGGGYYRKGPSRKIPRNGYAIQRMSKAERFIRDSLDQPLLYFDHDTSSFYKASFKRKKDPRRRVMQNSWVV